MLPPPRIAGVSLPELEASRACVVVAHPDDETIGCGALLARLPNVSVIVVTDGSPRDGADADRAGFDSPEQYRSARASELRAALAVAGIAERQIVEFAMPDQRACRSMVAIAGRLAAFFDAQRIEAVLTHAYEGGHPDHDATALCVHAAARLSPITVIEMPFYHLGVEGMATQSFCDGRDDLVMRLTQSEIDLKTRMISAHASQAQTLQPFEPQVERYRMADGYDFRAPANGGRILYEYYDWGLSPRDWPRLAGEALRALNLQDAPCR